MKKVSLLILNLFVIIACNKDDTFVHEVTTIEILTPNTSYPIVDTGVVDFYSNSTIISAVALGEAFYGQDATYQGNQPSYTNNNDGTITDDITGLM